MGLSTSSVHDRLQRLRREGVIQRWTVEIAPETLGLPVLALIGIKASRHCGDLVGPLTDMPEVVEYHAVAGAFGAFLKVRATSPEHPYELIERLRRIPGVTGTETTVVLKTYVERGPQPPSVP